MLRAHLTRHLHTPLLGSTDHGNLRRRGGGGEGGGEGGGRGRGERGGEREGGEGGGRGRGQLERVKECPLSSISSSAFPHLLPPGHMAHVHWSLVQVSQ